MSENSYTLSQKLYRTNAFASVYEQVVGKFSSEFLWEGLKEKFLTHIPPDGTILEIGAGPGILATKILQHYPEIKIIVTDFSPKMVSLAKKNYQECFPAEKQSIESQPRVRFVQADVMDLSQFSGETIDGIYSMGAIKYFPDVLQALNQCTNILKTGGRMYFSDFSAEGPLSDTRKIAKYLRMPSFLKFIVMPLVHLEKKQKAPGNEEIQRWKQHLEKSGDPRLENSPGNPDFTLTYTKS